jgi:nucleotide-binding universal stress UspA family protein
MSCKSVFCVIGADRCDRDIMNAINLCRELDMHLSVLVVGLAPFPMGGHGALVSDSWILEREADVRAIKIRQMRIKSLANAYGILADVSICYTDKNGADDMVGQRARFSDITIVGPDLLHQPELKAPAINGALFHSGRPILIIPGGKWPTLCPATVLLAWDSRIEAVRAAREAIDVMTRAREVHVTMIDTIASTDASEIEPRADIAAYLALHGVKVTIDRVPSEGRSIAQALKQHATKISADMLVMGAYGHSRLHERLFGGVTKSMIDYPTLPVFMMH